jgi:hypothetical protein
MRQLQRNLFFSYRGAADRKHADLILERQLEDNTTKALIYVLEHSNRAAVLEPFLRTVVGVKGPIARDETQFVLQRVDIARTSVRERVAFSVAPIARREKGHGGTQKSGRPDAWIWTDNGFSVLIENKIRGAATHQQLARHVQGAQGWSTSTVRHKEASWGEVYDFFAAMKQRLRSTDSTTGLLTKEFLRYLRMTGLASDTVFDLEDFGYFLLPLEDRDATTRALLSRKLQRFTKELTESHALRPVLREYSRRSKAIDFVSPGVFRKKGDQYWITIGPKQQRKRCHFTVRLTETGIALEAFAPHKSFTQRLARKIAAQPEVFLRSLRHLKLGDAFHFRLREAHYTYPDSSYKGQQISQKIDFLLVHPATLTKEHVRQLIVEPLQKRLLEKTLRPELFLVRHFSLSELVGNPKVVDLVAGAAAPMLPYLRFALDL